MLRHDAELVLGDAHDLVGLGQACPVGEAGTAGGLADSLDQEPLKPLHVGVRETGAERGRPAAASPK